MPLRVATDPAYRGRGIFGELEAQNEERVRELGVRLLLTVPNAASAPVFLERLGWTALPSVRVWARLRLGLRRPRTNAVSGLGPGGLPRRSAAIACCATPTGSTGASQSRRPATRCSRAPGTPSSAVAGARVSSPRSPASCLPTPAAVGAPVAIAAPPPWQHRRYARGGYVPTHRTFTVLGKALDPGQAVPARPQFELGDLDFLMSKLVFVTQVVDPEDPMLGAVVGKLRALAARVDEVVVLAGRPSTACCRTTAASCLRRGLAGRARARSSSPALHAGALAAAARRRRPHASRCYAILAAPLVAAARRAAPALVHALEAQPDARARRAALDRGADRRPRARSRSPRRRSSRSATASTPTRSPASSASPASGCASSRSGAPRRRRDSRRSRAPRARRRRARGLRAVVTAEERDERERLLRARRPRSRPGPVLGGARRCSPAKDVLVNNMREGSLDKVVYEAAATCMPVLASNTRLRRRAAAGAPLPARRPRGARATRLRTLSDVDRNALGRELRARVERAPFGRPLGRRRARGGAAGDRPARPEGRRHLRLRGAPAPAPARPRRSAAGTSAS